MKKNTQTERNEIEKKITLNPKIDYKNFSADEYLKHRVKRARAGLTYFYSMFVLTIVCLMVGAEFSIFPELVQAIAIIGLILFTILCLIKYISINKNDFEFDCNIEQLKADMYKTHLELGRLNSQYEIEDFDLTDLDLEVK